MSPTPEAVDEWLQSQHTILWMDWLITSVKSRKLAVDWIIKFLNNMEELERNERSVEGNESPGGVLRTTGEPAPGGAKPEAFNSTSSPGFRGGIDPGYD